MYVDIRKERKTMESETIEKVEIRRWNKWTTGRVEKSLSEERNKNARQLQIFCWGG